MSTCKLFHKLIKFRYNCLHWTITIFPIATYSFYSFVIINICSGLNLICTIPSFNAPYQNIIIHLRSFNMLRPINSLLLSQLAISYNKIKCIDPCLFALRSILPFLVLCTHKVGEGRSLIFTLVKGMFTIIKKGTNDWIEWMICACTIMI